MGVEVDDRPASRAVGPAMAEPVAVGRLVAAAEDEGKEAEPEDVCHLLAEEGLGLLEGRAFALDVARVIEREAGIEGAGKVGRFSPDCGGSPPGARPPEVAPHALVAGEADEGHARGRDGPSLAERGRLG
jgi:hypothetical protein